MYKKINEKPKHLDFQNIRMCSTYHIIAAAVHISYIGTCNEWMCIWENLYC